MDKILYMGISGSVLIMAILCFRHFFSHQLPRRFMVFLWIFAMARLLFPVSIPVRWPLPGLQNPAVQSGSHPGASSASYDLLIEDAVSISSEEAGGASGSILSKHVRLRTLIFIVWLTAAVLLALKITMKHFRSCRIYHLSLPVCEEKAAEWFRTHHSFRKVTLRKSELAEIPLTYGILRPVILLPSTIRLDKEELLCILEHEWIHIRWWDVLVKYILYLTVCIYWFHPLVWIMAVLLNRDMEMACDEEVIQTHSDSLKTTYALALIRLAEGCRDFSGPMDACFARQSEIEERICTIMKQKKYSRKAAALAVGMICCAATTFTVSAQRSPETEHTASDSTLLMRNNSSADHNSDTNTMPGKDAFEEFDTNTGSSSTQEKFVEPDRTDAAANQNKPAADSQPDTPDPATNEQISKLAGNYIGAPYQHGGTDLASGVDSPGFIKAVYAQAGIELPADLQELAASGTEISVNELSAGDIIFYSDQTNTIPFFHAGIYNGRGQVVHASNQRDGVKISDFDYRKISMAVRILK